MPQKPQTFRPHGKPVPHALEAERGNAHARGYDWRWQRAAARFRHDNPLCVGCLAIDKLVASELVDHIVPHQGDRVLFWTQSNWQALCKWHHDTVKARLERAWLAGKVGVNSLRCDSIEAIAISRGGGRW